MLLVSIECVLSSFQTSSSQPSIRLDIQSYYHTKGICIISSRTEIECWKFEVTENEGKRTIPIKQTIEIEKGFIKSPLNLCIMGNLFLPTPKGTKSECSSSEVLGCIKYQVRHVTHFNLSTNTPLNHLNTPRVWGWCSHAVVLLRYINLLNVCCQAVVRMLALCTNNLHRFILSLK
jgi:hypothetical protein